MTMIEAALAALEKICPHVSFGDNADDPKPDSYIVLTVRDSGGQIYAGDRDEQGYLQLRAAWYARNAPQPRAKKIRCALRDAGFVITDTLYNYEQDTRYHAAYVEAETDDACDWNDESEE